MYSSFMNMAYFNKSVCFNYKNLYGIEQIKHSFSLNQENFVIFRTYTFSNGIFGIGESIPFATMMNYKCIIACSIELLP